MLNVEEMLILYLRRTYDEPRKINRSAASILNKGCKLQTTTYDPRQLYASANDSRVVLEKSELVAPRHARSRGF